MVSLALPAGGLRYGIPSFLALVGACAALADDAMAQANVRAWHAQGQVFVLWRVDAAAPLTYDIYCSTAPITSTAQGTLAGRVFEPEWQGLRLKLVKDTATWRVPTPGGGFYQLEANEGLFVHTPRAAALEHFSVVRDGNTVVSAANSTAAAVSIGYDPVNDPVSCHLQIDDVTSRGYPFRWKKTTAGSDPGSGFDSAGAAVARAFWRSAGAGARACTA